jgi:hypothetical protein
MFPQLYFEFCVVVYSLDHGIEHGVTGSVRDASHFHPDPALHVGADPDPALHVGADPNPAVHVGADLDPTLQVVADPDPTLHVGADPDHSFHIGADPDWPVKLQVKFLLY